MDHFPYDPPPCNLASFPKGTWSSEGCALAWIDSRTNLHCAMIRNPDFGMWCGYVAVPQGHPLHGKEYGDSLQVSVEFADRFLQRTVDLARDVGILNLILAREINPQKTGYLDVALALPAHGGITYSSSDAIGMWWFGFDCLHAGDRAPRHMPMMSMRDDTVYRDQPYVQGIVTRLAWAIEELRQVIEGDAADRADEARP